MLNNTQKVYERLIRGEFLSDSNNLDTKHLYQDVDENFDKYADYEMGKPNKTLRNIKKKLIG